jgi:hypothetical protein
MEKDQCLFQAQPLFGSLKTGRIMRRRVGERIDDRAYPLTNGKAGGKLPIGKEAAVHADIDQSR